jgi:hypothetical protein
MEKGLRLRPFREVFHHIKWGYPEIFEGAKVEYMNFNQPEFKLLKNWIFNELNDCWIPEHRIESIYDNLGVIIWNKKLKIDKFKNN